MFFGRKSNLLTCSGGINDAGNRRAALPIEVHGFDALERHVHGTIDRRAGAGEHADDDGGFVRMRGAHVGHAMVEHDAFARDVAQTFRDFRADHCFEHVLEGLSGNEREALPSAGLEMLEGRFRCSDDREATMRVTQRKRNRPRDQRMRGHVLEALPLHVVRRFPHAEHRIEHELHGAGARADDEIGARDRLRETLPRIAPHAIHSEQERDAQRDRRERHGKRQPAVPGAARGKIDEMSQATSRSACARVDRLQIDFTREPGGETPIVAHEKQCCACGSALLEQQFQKGVLAVRVQSGRRFIGDDELGPPQKSARGRDTLLLAHRKVRHVAREQ